MSESYMGEWEPAPAFPPAVPASQAPDVTRLSTAMDDAVRETRERLNRREPASGWIKGRPSPKSLAMVMAERTAALAKGERWVP